MTRRTILRPLLAVEDTPGMPEAIAAVVAASAGTVCRVCGLERMGHGPESVWLGYARHAWSGRPATAAEVAAARELTGEAYRRRNLPRIGVSG